MGNQYLTIYSRVVMSQLYSFDKATPVAYEIFFQKIVSRQGEVVGFFGRQGNDESEDVLHTDLHLEKVHEYSRAIAKSESKAASFYFRAALTMQVDFYEPYSVLRLLESSGGLWTSICSF